MKKIIKLLIAGLVCTTSFILTSCNKKNNDFYSAITNQCKLTREYKDKDFYKDGIGMATLINAIDGDTASFNLTSENTSKSRTVKIRFSFINTPESTGGVEKWGKSASLFTKDKLENAYEIVLEAQNTPAKTDSYGERYLGMVWYRNSEKDNFKNLNLLLVENGYTEEKTDISDSYSAYFSKAYKFAVEKKLHIHSDDDDPNFNNDPVQVTIKEIFDNIEMLYNEETKGGTKVHFDAYLTNLDAGDTYYWTAVQVVDGQKYSITIYSGYSNQAPSQGLKVGNYYSITGTVTKYNGVAQISGLKYSSLATTDPDYLSLKQSNYYMQFNSAIEYKPYFGTSLYSSVTIKTASISNNVLTIVGETRRQTASSLKDAEEYTFHIPVAEGKTLSGSLAGLSLTTKGIQETAKSRVIEVESINDTNLSSYIK